MEVRWEREEKVATGKLQAPSSPFVFNNCFLSCSGRPSGFATGPKVLKKNMCQLSSPYAVQAHGCSRGLRASGGPLPPCPRPLMRQKRDAKLYWKRPFTLAFPTWWFVHTDISMWGKEYEGQEWVRVELGWSTNIKFFFQEKKWKRKKKWHQSENTVFGFF